MMSRPFKIDELIFGHLLRIHSKLRKLQTGPKRLQHYKHLLCLQVCNIPWSSFPATPPSLPCAPCLYPLVFLSQSALLIAPYETHVQIIYLQQLCVAMTRGRTESASVDNSCGYILASFLFTLHYFFIYYFFIEIQ